MSILHNASSPAPAGITGHTRLGGLIGYPTAHSISPMMHNDSFRALGLDMVYLCFDVLPEQLGTVIPALRQMKVYGFNVTMPDKEAILPWLDELAPEAELIGAVNTVRECEGKLIGHNTDGTGFMRAAREEGVEFMTLHNPVEYVGDDKGRLCAMRVQRMELGEPDASGRRSPVPVPGAITEVPVDLVIVAVGVSPNQLVPSSVQGLEVSRRHTIVVDEETMCSNVSMLYAGGDIVRGGATVILAMGDGRRAAAAMAAQLQSE